jgi:hypothetical protein
MVFVFNTRGDVCENQPMSFSKETIPDYLNWLLSILELLIVFAIASLVGYAVFCFLLGTSQEVRFTRLMQVVNENWKAALVLLIPLFYRPIRVFLENLEEAGSLKRRKSIPASSQQEETNPPAMGKV